MATPVARKNRRTTAVEANQAPPDPVAIAAGPDTPPPLPSELIGMSTATALGPDANAPMPPMLDEVLAAAGVSAGWVYNRAITHLWSYDASTGVWVWVDGIGWKRLSPASAFGHGHMTELATIATHRNLPVDYHEDAAGQIDQLLV
jgi:hypothetical protein